LDEKTGSYKMGIFGSIGKVFIEKAITIAVNEAIGGLLNKAADFMKQIAAHMIEDFIQGLDIPDSWKNKMLEAFRDAAGLPQDEPAKVPEQPVKGTPIEQGELDRNIDKLGDTLQQLRALINQMLSEGGGENTSGTGKNQKGNKEGTTAPLSGDFFTTLAKAIGETLKMQAEEVRARSAGLSSAVADNIKAKEQALAGQGSKGLSDTEAVKAKNRDDHIMTLQTDLSAESMKLNFLSTGLQSALKAVGDSLSTMGRS
jgi:hypothetical protein